MNKRIAFIATIAFMNVAPVEAQNNDWENPKLLDLGKEMPHVSYVPFDQQKDALADDYNLSANFKSLNGQWKFNYVDQYKNRSTNFYKTSVDDSAWANITVPSNWELQSFGIPIYTNIMYPHPKNTPLIGPDNPVGTYRKTFTIPENWDEKEVLVHFGSISGCAFVYVPGVFRY